MAIDYAWRGPFDNAEVNALHAEALERRVLDRDDWVGHVERQTRAAGCEWLQVDFEPHLRDFDFGACGGTPTDAGLVGLK